MNLRRLSSRTPLPVGAVFIAACALAACGGGSVFTPGAVPVATPTPPVIPAQAPFTQTTSQPLPPVTPPPAGQTPAPVPVAIPSAGGYSGTVSLPVSGVNSIPAGTTLQEQITSTAPSGLPPLSLARAVQATRHASSNFTALLYLQLFFSAGVTLSNQPAITIQLPAGFIPAGSNLYVALFDPLRPSLGWQDAFEGPGVVSGNSVSFTGNGSPFSFAQFSPYWFALYAVSAAAPTPTPAPVASTSPLPTPTPSLTPTPSPTPTPTPIPTPTPTPTPIPAFAITPTSLSFTATAQTQTFTASGAAPFSVSIDHSTVASVSPSSGTGTFTVTALGAGTAGVTVTDALGRSASVSITVTTTTVPIQ